MLSGCRELPAGPVAETAGARVAAASASDHDHHFTRQFTAEWLALLVGLSV